MPYHPEKDLAPISMLAMIPFFLVAHPSQPSSLKELIETAKAKPGALSYGHGGQGSTMHLAGELLNMMASIRIQAVPYKGSGPVSADVLGGQVPLGVVDVPSAIANVSRKAARARCDDEAPHFRCARSADLRGSRPARLRGDRLVRRRGAGGHASRNHQ